MYFKQFYLGCLAHASYLIGSNGVAAVVDPQRDVDQYIKTATDEGMMIKYVIETHLHADFVSGHQELAARTGAEIIFGRQAQTAFPHRPVSDGDELLLGKVILRFLETPGHTPEGISVLVTDTELSDQPQKVLTGDTLFIGDVGRPDLAGAKGYSPEQMAGMLYDSLHGKLLKLHDQVEINPAHGAGSLCGRNISKETCSTIGEQRQTNYALKVTDRAEFIRLMTTDLPEQPAYFSRDAEINRSGAPMLAELGRPVALAPPTVNLLLQQDHIILDVRPSHAFGAGHIPCAINLGLGGQFASWAGCLIPPGTRLILVAEDESEVDEAVLRLARVGIENVAGYLGGGIYEWSQSGLALAQIRQIAVDELAHQLAENADLQVLDVRQPAEFKSGHVPGAVNLPLAHLLQQVHPFDSARTTAVICAGGYRSIAGCSLLAGQGFQQIVNVVGGTSAWQKAGFPLAKPELIAGQLRSATESQ